MTELLIEVDRETRFSTHLTHAGGANPRHPELEHRRNLYAAILAQACNFGITRMAELTAIPADAIDWATQWYLREDTLRPANTAIVNAHHRHALAGAWGGGTLSSSDGLRLPMRGRSLTGRALSRYFVHEGLTSYTHVSDQHSTYGTQIIVSTERDATFTLDEILGNTTELPIFEHTTDSHGQTLATFALFDLVGLRLSPRIAKLAERQLWRPYPAAHYQRWPLAGPLLQHHVQVDLIAEHWDDLLRIGGSLKQGHVSAALLTAGQELVPPLRHRRLRRPLTAGRLGDRHLAPQHRQDDPNLVFLRLLRWPSHRRSPSVRTPTLTCLGNLDTRHHHRLPPGRRRRPTGRGAPRQRRNDRPPEPRPLRGDQPLRDTEPRHRRRPQTQPETTSPPLTRISGHIVGHFGAVSQERPRRQTTPPANPQLLNNGNGAITEGTPRWR